MAKHGLYRHQLPAVFSYGYRRHIGLLGGSYNPAHDGHIALSKAALLTGKCDQIWWLVSPQNPLKSAKDMANYEARLRIARALTKPYPWIRVLALEMLSGSRYSFETVTFLKKRSPKARFTWIMGTDNLVQFPQWHRAKDFARLTSFMVFARRPSLYHAHASHGRALFRSYKAPSKLQLIPQFDDAHSATKLRVEGFWEKQGYTQGE